MMRTHLTACLGVALIVASISCGDESSKSVKQAKAETDLTQDQAHALLAGMLWDRELEITELLHRNQRLIRENPSIKPQKNPSWDPATERWTLRTYYGFFGVAEATVNSQGGDPRIIVKNIEDTPNWTQALVVQTEHSQQDGGSKH